MRMGLLACGVLAAGGLAGCAGPEGGGEAGVLGRLAAVATPPPPEPSAKEVAKLVSRSVWGVVPDAPRRKQDLRPELIRGSAVAVADGTLLASCRVAGKRVLVGLVRHNKYKIAKVRAVDKARRVCALEVDDVVPVVAAGGFRSVGDLRAGEPVYAIVSRTSAEFAVAEGRVAGRPGGGADGLIEADLALPAGARSAVLVDARGNLVGLGSGETRGVATLVAPVTARAAPRLANRDLGVEVDGPPTVRLAALSRPPPDPPRSALVVFRDEPDRDDDGSREVAAAATRAETPDDGTGEAEAGADPGDGGDRKGDGAGRDAGGPGRNGGEDDRGGRGGRGSGRDGLGGFGGFGGLGGLGDGGGGRGRDGGRGGGRDGRGDGDGDDDGGDGNDGGDED